MASQTTPVAQNIGMQAAKASSMAPVVGVFLNITANGAGATMQQKLIISIASFFIYAIGLVLGTFAMTKVRQYGSKGIIIPAIVGIVINGLLVFVFSLVIFLALLSRK